MNLNCPKCGKEIAEGDIEEKKFYCCTCIEWFTKKEELAGKSPKKDNLPLKDTTDNKRTRHKIVTIWLWASIVANAISVFVILLIILFEAIGTPRLRVFALVSSIAVIIGHVLVLKWKIAGFFSTVFVFIFSVYLLMVANYYEFKPQMLLLMLPLSVFFGILNIRKNGISTWRHLLNEAKANKRETKISLAVVFGSIFLALIIFIFPIKIIYGNIIVLFAPDRLDYRYESYNGSVLGYHVLKTEYGEIRVKPLAKVTRFWGNFDIDYENFESGRASHDLVVYGINMPKNIEVRINSWFTNAVISSIYVGKNVLNISGISVFSRRIDTYGGYPYGRGASLLINFADEYITLSDSTQIDVRYFEGYLDIDVYSQQWELIPSTSWFYSLGVMLPGETEFTRYKFITFKENWGAFIKGDLPDR
jgi:hypothetical protein